MSTDLDGRAREAAEAARCSVTSAAAHAAHRGTPRPRRAGVRLAVAAAGLAILAGVAAVSVSPDAGTTQVATGSAPSVTPAPTPPPVPPPPPPGPPPALPSGTVVGRGATSNGRPWTLSIGGPSNELCLQFHFDDRNNTGGSCAGQPFGLPVPAEERYRPLLVQDSRVPAHVFGRVAPGVVQVEVVLASGKGTSPQPVIPGESSGDGFYAVELAGRDEPRTVIAIRSDGTTTRHPLRP